MGIERLKQTHMQPAAILLRSAKSGSMEPRRPALQELSSRRRRKLVELVFARVLDARFIRFRQAAKVHISILSRRSLLTICLDTVLPRCYAATSSCCLQSFVVSDRLPDLSRTKLRRRHRRHAVRRSPTTMSQIEARTF